MGEKDFIAISRKSRGLSIFEQGIRGTKKFENAMKKFTRSNKITCKAVPQEIPRVPRPERRFATGSTYTGEWNELGISGKGIYCFPPDVNGEITRFEGEFDDGKFEGDGKIYYPSGAILRGKWKSGVNYEPELVFPDGLEFSSQQWRYCKYPDRRYTVEYDNGLEPAGNSYITSTKPARPIPEGFYDVGYGFYDPRTQHIYNYNDLSSIISAVGPGQRKWIEENCRTEPLEPLGPCPFLFKEWVAPMLEAEDPPIPATKTMNFLEQLLFRDESFEERNKRQWWKYGYRQQRTSIVSLGSESSFGRSDSTIGRGSVRIASSRRQSTTHRAPLKFATGSGSFDKKASFADPRHSSVLPSLFAKRTDSQQTSALSVTKRQSVLMPLPTDRKTSEQQPADDRSIYRHFVDPRRSSDRQSVDQQSIRQIFENRFSRQSADQQSVRQSFAKPRFSEDQYFYRRQSSMSRQSSVNPWPETDHKFKVRSDRLSESDDIKVLFKHSGARSTPF